MPVSILNFTYQPNFRDSYHGVLFGFWGTPRRAFNSVLFGLIFGGLLAWALWDQPVPTNGKLLIAVLAGLLWIGGFSLLFGAFAARLMTSRQKARGDDVIQVTDQWIERTSGTLRFRQDGAASSGSQRRRECSGYGTRRAPCFR